MGARRPTEDPSRFDSKIGVRLAVARTWRSGCATFWQCFGASYSSFRSQRRTRISTQRLRNWGRYRFRFPAHQGFQQQFNRGVALLHSFAYDAAGDVFRGAAERDRGCAIPHWGVAMTHFHQLWDPPLSSATISIAREQMRRARAIGTRSQRERKFIDALSLIYDDDSAVPYATRFGKAILAGYC
jgi:hypothetical protein